MMTMIIIIATLILVMDDGEGNDNEDKVNSMT